MYLITRDLLKDLDAVGGGFMSQLEWGSDLRGIPLPVADAMESFFNSTFDHNGRKVPTPFATEADVQGLLTMLFFSALTGGNPPLFMDFRKVWEKWELEAFAQEVGVQLPADELWAQKGLVDGDNSGSASFDWAAKPGASVEEIMANVYMPLQDRSYFPGMGNSATFVSPGGLAGITGPAGLQHPIRPVWPKLGRGHHRRGAGQVGRRAILTRRTMSGRTPLWCPSTPRCTNTSTTRPLITFT